MVKDGSTESTRSVRGSVECIGDRAESTTPVAVTGLLAVGPAAWVGSGSGIPPGELGRIGANEAHIEKQKRPMEAR